MADRSLAYALKEWDSVCRALEWGRQTILLRKGGISESAGEFQVEHRRFVLFPTFLHQNLNMLKPEAHGGFEPHAAEPTRITLGSMAEVTDVIQLKNRSQMDRIDAQHVWTAPLIDMRFGYRPESPLYLLIVRAYRLGRPVTTNNTAAYAGCKSWVPLDEGVDVSGARAALDDSEFARRRASIIAALNEP
jgi:hypothetical protein